MDILARIGGLIALIGWMWLIIIGFQKGGILWGILIIMFNWIGGIPFAIVHKTGWMQLGLLLVGLLLAVIGFYPFIYQRLSF